LLFNFAVEYVIRRAQVHQEGLKLFLVYIDDEILGEGYIM
jgi:hypothetical protein